MKCVNFLNKISLTTEARKQLQLATISQRESKKWHDERKLRITSSNFGRICKAQNSSSFKKIIESIQNPKKLKTPAVTHGIEFEKKAKEAYLEKMTVECESTGLVIHSNMQFLAASPDGLIGDDGIIEIKCPFNAKNEDPDKYKLAFLNESGSALLQNHNYHYQIQGLLEICDRS